MENISRPIRTFRSRFFDTDDPDYLCGYEIFFIWIICAILGACLEMVYSAVTNGYVENRSSLVYGPFGLAYSIGGVLMTILLHNDRYKPNWKIFLKAFLIGSVAEYIMSLGMELVFHHVAWDYSNMPLNINGRICLLYSCFWGLLGLAWTKLACPFFHKLICAIPKEPGKIIFWIVFVFFLYDCIISAEAALRFNARQEGIPPQTRMEAVLDKQFPDWYLKKTFANSMGIDDEGNISDQTLSGQDSHNPIVGDGASKAAA